MGLAGRAGRGVAPARDPPAHPTHPCAPGIPLPHGATVGPASDMGVAKKEHLRFSIGRDMEPPKVTLGITAHPSTAHRKHLIQDVKHLVSVGLETLFCVILGLVRGKGGSRALWVWAPHIPAPQEGGTGQPGGARRAVQCRYRILPEGGGLELI